MSDHWNLSEMPRLSGKNVIVTGANSGIGYSAARELALRGARVILACRDAVKGVSAAQQIRQLDPSAQVEAMTLDLADLSSVRAFASRALTELDHINILVNNAGIMMNPFEKTADGFESQFGVNHLGHFALTGLLYPAIAKSKSARIVNVASLAHSWGHIDVDNLMHSDADEYDAREAYGNSKLANLLFTLELQKRLDDRPENVIAVAAHPGASLTNLGRHLEKRWYFKMLKPLAGLVTQSPDDGALPTLRAATDPNVSGGEYFGPDGFKQYRGAPVQVGRSREARDDQAAAELWRASEELTRVSFNF